MKKRIFSIFSFFILGLFPAFMHAQETPIVVSPLIGDTLDIFERDSYKLFPDWVGFQNAVFYLNSDSTLNVKIALIQDGVKQDILIKSYCKLVALRNQIEESRNLKTKKVGEVKRERKTLYWSKGKTYENVNIKLTSGSILDNMNLTIASDSEVILTYSSFIKPKTISLSDINKIQVAKVNYLLEGGLVGTAVGIVTMLIGKSIHEESAKAKYGSETKITYTPLGIALGIAIIGGSTCLGMLIGSQIISEWETIYSKEEASVGFSLDFCLSNNSHITPVLNMGIRF